MKRYQLTAVIWKEKRHFVSKCPELGVASYGRTPEGARQALQEAVTLYLDNARTLDLLDDLHPVLSSHAHYTTTIDVTIS